MFGSADQEQQSEHIMETVVGKMIGQPGSANESGMPAAACAPDPEQEPKAAPSSDWGAPLFVGGIWALLLLAALAYIVRYGDKFPWWGDEWDYVPAMTGEQPITPAYLWRLHNDHRLPLPKLLWLGVLKLTNFGDFRAATVVNALVLAGLALALIVAVKKRRGWLSYSDAFFPLALMLQWEPLFGSWSFTNVFPMVVACALLVIILSHETLLPLGAGVLAGACLLCLPLSGGSGLAYVPALATWLGWVGLRHWLSGKPHGRRNGLVMLVFVALALLVVGLHFYTYDGPPHARVPVWDALGVSFAFFSVGLGVQPAVGGWPYLEISVFTLFVASAVLLVLTWWRRLHERFRAVGLLLFLGGFCSLALALGWGRGGPDPLLAAQYRYTIMGFPALGCIYCVWVLYGPPRLGRLVQMCLFTLLCVLSLPNVQEGLEFGRNRRQELDAFEHDLLAGTPASLLLQRHASAFGEDGASLEYLRKLHDAEIGQFRFLQDDPPFREVPIPMAVIGMNQMTWEDSRGEGHGEDPYLIFALPSPQFVYCIRLKCSYEKLTPPATLQVFWRRSAENDFVAEERNTTVKLDTSAGEHTVTVQVNNTIDQFRIDPDFKPCVFKLGEIVLLERAQPEANDHAIGPIRQVADRMLPPDAIVLVVSDGDDGLLKLGLQRQGWHFPRDAKGNYDGKPANSAEAIARLEQLRSQGAGYLLVPEPSFWWLDYYKEFKQHLEGHAQCVHKDADCILYRLTASDRVK